MTQPVSLLAAPFVPTTSIAGSEPTRLFRGQNVIVKALGDTARLETFPGVKNLGESYDIDSWTLTGTVTWTAGSTTVTITAGAALTELRPGQMFLAGAEIFVVNRVESNTSVIVERAPTTTDAVGTTGHFMPVLFEVDNKRGVLRRGNAIAIDRRDLLFVGQGNLYLNGTDTTFAASRRPQRLQRDTGGSYTLVPFGFPNAPPRPVFTVGVGAGQKNMQAGKYSFMASYWNSVTGGFSNPSDLVKTTTGGTELTIIAGGFFDCDVTDIRNAKPTNADGVIIWGSLSGGGVTDINTSNFNQGAWYEVARIQFTAKTITAVDLGADTITIPNHRFRNGNYLIYTRTGGTTDIGGLTSGTRYYVIVVDKDTIKLASTVANYRANTAIDLNTTVGDGTQTIGALDSSDIFPVEYLDAEVGNIASGDNDQPPECEWVANFANTPFYISCFGRVTSTNPFGESLGNFVLSSKQSNIEAAPVSWRVSLGAEITGFASGVGRLFCLTRNGIPFVTPTGRTELSRLSPTLLDFPFTARPFATKGGISPYNLMLVQNDLYMFTGGMPLRSPSMTDEKASPFELGRTIEDVILTWKDGYTFVAHDPQNRHVCFVGSAVRKNASGYWESEIYPLDLSGSVPMWQPKILLTSTTEDRIVSGVAVVNNRFEFLCGGRTATKREVKTFRYYEGDGTAIPYYIVFQPTDLGEELRSKMMRSIRVTGRVNSLVAQIHGAAPGGEVSIANIEAGTNSLSGDITIGSSSGLRRMFRTKYLVKNLGIAALRLAGTWPGTGDPDRIDEVVIEVGTHGRKV